MTPLKADDLRRFSKCVGRLYQCQDIAEFPRVAMAAAVELVPGHLVSYTEINPVRDRAVALLDPPEFDLAKIAPTFMRLRLQHPVIDYHHRTGDGRAAKVSDFLSLVEWHRTEIYQQVYGPMRVEDQFSITLPAPQPIVLAVVISREKRTFTERDRAVLNEFRSHMVAAYELADRAGRLRHDAQTAGAALESMDVGLVRVTPSRDVSFVSAKARLWMERHLPEPAGGPSRLPDLIDHWLVRTTTAAAADVASPAGSPLRIESADEVLEVRCKRMDGGDVLLLMECQPRTKGVEALLAMGLSPREAEVLYWVREGKTNPEVGIILGTSPRTVQKQLEKVFKKLGVATRTAAATAASEAERRGG